MTTMSGIEQPEAGARSARLTFDAVIATRNRPEALALSIPLILSQDRLPEKLVVIDSSDDHAPAADAVARAVAASGYGGPVIVRHSPPGLTLQRNLGLQDVTADVVLFPDDDSLFHPGVSAALMEAYERDPRVVGVCAADAAEPPEGALPADAYSMTAAQKRESAFALLRNRLERRVNALNPALYLGEVVKSRAPRFDWLADDDCVLVERMTGYRMSFRADAIRRSGFETAFAGYSLSEDVDASFAVARLGALIGARRARIYHHKHPGRRAKGFALGAMALTNRAYVIAKHSVDLGLTPEQTRIAKSRMRGYARLKVLASLLGARDRFGRDRLRGAWAGMRALGEVLDAPRDQLETRYLAVKTRLGL